ncbi:Head-to-tail connector protein [Erwinia rhapontici]|uniref:hypothetical protein n=1 Tax=Erwinia rhapontici TaxID=55212 RepID=UPI001331AB95|nr:hypothetical protein [Erwinia rhapontici]MBP2157130.1 hypothetical protein [Erwinia rhapontici]NKG30416.1 hypothetical protein [Erwinia rhapontici]
MAGLTREQKAEREAQKLAEQQNSDQTNTQTAIGANAPEIAGASSDGASVSQQPALTDGGDNDADLDGKLAALSQQLEQQLAATETVMMVRSSPAHPGGPVEADVHPNDVHLWIDEGWVKDTSEEA